MNISSIPVPHVLKTATWITRLAYAIAVIGIFGSYGTQAVLLLAHQVGMFSYILPATIDLLAFAAALALQLPDLPREDRRIAGKILTVAIVVSVAANVAGGHDLVARAAHAWPVIAYLLGELIANRVRAYAARLAAAQAEHDTPKVPAIIPANAPVSPGMPALIVDTPEAIAFRAAAGQLRRTSALPGLNGKSN
jgi:uncharacterized protein DUF2637